MPRVPTAAVEALRNALEQAVLSANVMRIEAPAMRAAHSAGKSLPATAAFGYVSPSVDELAAAISRRLDAEMPMIERAAGQGYAPIRPSMYAHTQERPGYEALYDTPDAAGFHGGKYFGVPDLDVTDLGLHAGTMRAANYFARQKPDELATVRALVATKPNRTLVVEGDLGDWDFPQHWLQVLGRQVDQPGSFATGSGQTRKLLNTNLDPAEREALASAFQKAMDDGLFSANHYMSEGSKLKNKRMIRALLRAHGIDRILYRNGVEDPGHVSALMLDDTQMRDLATARFDPEQRGVPGLSLALPALASLPALRALLNPAPEDDEV